MISFVVFSLLTQTSNPPFLGAILGKLRKFIISPIQYWRDLFYKHPNFARYIPAKIVHRVNKARESEGNPTGGCSSGEDWKDRLALVSRRIKEKNYEEAEIILQDLLRKERFSDADEHFRLLCLASELSEKQEHWREAAERWRAVLNCSKKDDTLRYYRNIFNALLRDSQVDEAESILRSTLKLFPIPNEYRNSFLKFQNDFFGLHGFSDEFLYFILLKSMGDCVRKSGGYVVVVSHPELARLKNKSKYEIEILKNKKPSKEYIQKLHEHCPYDFASEIKSSAIITVGGVMRHADYQSQYVNFADGMRVVTDQPDTYEKSVYCVGNSHYTSHSEDRYTISSCLQKLFNEHNHSIRVVNASVSRNRPANQAEIIKRLPIKNGDIVLIEFLGNIGRNKIKDFCTINGMGYYDLNLDFMNSRYVGEIFIDQHHVTYVGNMEIANILYKNVFKYEVFSNSAPYRGMEKIFYEMSTKASSYGSENGGSGALSLSVDNNYKDIPIFDEGSIGAIVMNCNPITKGHMHLINIASQIVDHLYIFVVQEDRSFFSFSDRIDMVRLATPHLNNLVIVPSGKFILSAETFPEYFDKDMKQNAEIDTSHDIGIFHEYIAKKFNISIRFIGEEPNDMVTRQYNDEMKRSLPENGIQVIEIPRLKSEKDVISASRVRSLLKGDQWDEIAEICPETTVLYLKSMKEQGRL